MNSVNKCVRRRLYIYCVYNLILVIKNNFSVDGFKNKIQAKILIAINFAFFTFLKKKRQFFLFKKFTLNNSFITLYLLFVYLIEINLRKEIKKDTSRNKEIRSKEIKKDTSRTRLKYYVQRILILFLNL